MRCKTILLLATVCSSLGSIAESCTLQRPLLSMPLEYRADCRFKNAGREDFGSGGPSYDFDGGFVYQLMVYANNDDMLAKWVVSDCNTRQFSVVTPKIDTSFPSVCGPDYEHDDIENPKSALRKALKTGGPESFESVAAELDYNVGELGWVSSYGRNGFTASNKSILSRRVDPFCGCPIWYPEMNANN